MLGIHQVSVSSAERLHQAFSTVVLLSDQHHHKESRQHTKWVQVMFAAFAEKLGTRP